ncbi:uncharacterized protein LOC127966584 [Carassius gibelio]|uniref:uncharacterized protein LOC127966584 n=1 Tax=Carassius gibelio TaxID=101364 RepID=UPI0022799AD8|nr:uncharacterized protein LOC127966584 [Carassius gibelio]XP_052423650.1 uncharacterized protein LOC127966584 [Carassius gibelio]XP_052423651.1 uncharacterized protein LOC127966584 [Carassius gibelio]
MDKKAEVLVCGASIMKDVWEIRLREYRQKRQMEEERIRKSALERINQDWKGRMSFKIKSPKRLERKAKLPEQSTLDAHKAKKTNLGRPQGFQSSRIQRQVDSRKTTKANKLTLLRQLNESCPGLMVWAESWKFSQPLPQPEESPCAFDWGQSWKFLNFQPSTDGKPWFDLGFDANNDLSSNDIFLWEKLSKPSDPEHIKQDLVTPEWEKSWIFSQKRKEFHENKNNSYCNKLYNQNEEIASDWNESWKSTKPVKEVDVKYDFIQPAANEEKQPWNNSGMHFKNQLQMKSKATDNSAWSESWRVAKTMSEKETKSIQSQAKEPEELHPDICNLIINVSKEMKHKIQCRSQFGGRENQLPEWEKSWTTIKNLSEYKEEINKEIEVKVETLKPDMQPTEHVNFNVLALPKSQKRQEMLNFSEQINWKDSWKMMKHQHREERALRNRRKPPSQFSQTLTQWANCWKFTNLTLEQDAGLWQQGWSANSQLRSIRRVRVNEDIPHNGPAGVRTWAESWRSTRHQHLLEIQATSASTQLLCHHTYARSVADWEQSWKSSSHLHHHDRPSMTAWTGSWRFSSLEDLQREHAWFERSMEIKGRKELCRALNALNRSFDSQTFKERYPANEWNDSWRVKKKFDGPGLAQLMKNVVLNWDNSWMLTSTEFYQKQIECYLNSQIESWSEWGRSWKMSNPQPPKNIASWVDAKPRSFNAQDLILWSKHKHIYNLPSASLRDVKLKMWSKSWRFMTIDLDSKSEDTSVIMTKTVKIRRQMYSDIDQLKPQMKRWSDACKIAKTQARKKHDVRSKSGNMEDEDGDMFAEWMESWKFSNNIKTGDPANVSLSNWKMSWKFLLGPNVTMNGPKTSKNR